MMLIRDARPDDAEALVTLLADLDYPASPEFVATQISRMALNPDSVLWVSVLENQVCGFISLHFIPQLPLEGDFCRISYLCVSGLHRGAGIGQRLLEETEQLADERGCDRIEVHSHSRRVRAHQFYARAGYEESPKYLIKRLC